jgi:hypothetical protein
MEHCYRLDAGSGVSDWQGCSAGLARPPEFDTQPGISQPVRDVHDADGMEVLAPSK